MLCVEVTVNGTRRALAAVGDLTTFGAWIVYNGRRDGFATAHLHVGGVSRDESTTLEWIGDDHRLSAGDVVRIRVTEALAADVPVASPHEPVRFPDLRRAALKALLAEARAGTLLRNPTVRNLLLCLAVMVLGLLIELFASR